MIYVKSGSKSEPIANLYPMKITCTRILAMEFPPFDTYALNFESLDL